MKTCVEYLRANYSELSEKEKDRACRSAWWSAVTDEWLHSMWRQLPETDPRRISFEESMKTADENRRVLDCKDARAFLSREVVAAISGDAYGNCDSARWIIMRALESEDYELAELVLTQTREGLKKVRGGMKRHNASVAAADAAAMRSHLYFDWQDYQYWWPRRGWMEDAEFKVKGIRFPAGSGFAENKNKNKNKKTSK